MTTIVIVGIGIPKAVYSYHGQSLISPSLDWVGGVIVTILLVFILEIGFTKIVELTVFRLFWLGVIEATRSELCPSFFQYDWGPDILRILRRVNNPRSLLGSVSRRPTPLIPQRSPTDSTLLPVTQRAETAPVPLRPNTTSPIPNYDESHPEIVMQEGPQPVTYSGWSHGAYPSLLHLRLKGYINNAHPSTDDSEDRQHGSSSINDMYIGDSSEETGYSSSYMLASGPTSHFDDFDFGPRECSSTLNGSRSLS